MDETRKMIVRHGGHTTETEEKEKVFVYSAFRISIIDAESNQLHPTYQPKDTTIKGKLHAMDKLPDKVDPSKTLNL